MKTLIVLSCLITAVCFGTEKPPLRIFNGEGSGMASPLLTVKDYAYTVKEQELGVEFQLGKDDAKKLSEISQHYVGKHLVFSLGDSPLTTAKLRDVIKGTGIWLTVPDQKSLKAVERVLAGGQ
jgi:hypothetical protein